MRIITDDNIEQIENMSYSNNIEKLTNDEIQSDNSSLIAKIKSLLTSKLKERIATPDENDFTPDIDPYSPPYAPGTPGTPNVPRNKIVYDPDSPPYSAILGRVMTEEEFNAAQNASLEYDPESPVYDPNSPPYAPNSPGYDPNSPPYAPGTPPFSPHTLILLHIQ